jgi:hypothetical protein
MALEVVNFQGAQGPAGADGQDGQDGTDGAGGATAWAPGSSYAVGSLVVHEGQLWRLTATEPGNGYRSKPEVVAWSQTEHATGSLGVKTCPSAITSAATTGDLIVLVTHQSCSGSWSPASPSNMTEVLTRSLAMGSGGNHGIRIHYADAGGTVPTYDFGANRGRATWLLVRGASQTALTSKTFYEEDAAGTYFFPQLSYPYFGFTAPSTSLNLTTVLYGFDTAAQPIRFASNKPDQVQRHIGNQGQIGSHTSALFAGVVAWDDFQWYYYEPRYGFTYTGTPKFTALSWFIPASGTTPHFDRDVWVPAVYAPGDGDQLDENDCGVATPFAISTREANRRVKVTLDSAFLGSAYPQKTQLVYLREPRDPQVKNWCELTVEVPTGVNVRTIIPSINTTYGRNPVAGYAEVQIDPARQVEFGKLGPTSSTVMLEWSVDLQAWEVTGSSGAIYTRDWFVDDSVDQDALLPLLFSPEIQRHDSFGEILTAHRRGLASLPVSARRLMGRAGVMAHIVSPKSSRGASEVLLEAPYQRSQDAYTAGSAVQTLGQFANGSAQSCAWWNGNAGNTIDGRVMLHELGHAWNYNALTLLGIGSGYLSNLSAIQAIRATITSNGSYYQSNADEWMAQILFIYWAYQIPAILSGETSALATLKNDVTSNDTSKYDAVIAHLVSIGAVPSYGSWV